MVFIKDEKEVNLEELVLVPHFVVKTKIFTPYKIYDSGTKFFINVCSNNKIPTKELKNQKGKIVEDFDPKLFFSLISNGEWEIPILTSPEIRETLDKKRNKSLLIDCAINDKYIKWCLVNEDLKDILIQWCIDAIEFQIGGNFVIDRDSVSLPKRACIGGSPLNIQVDLHHLNNISKELEDLSKDMYEDNDDPLTLLNAKRLDDYDDENKALTDDGGLPPLIPLNASAKTKKLIVEVKDHPSPKPSIPLKKESVGPGKIRFEVSISKLQEFETQKNHKYELRVSSQLRSYQNYRLKYDSTAKDLIITDSRENNVPVLNFPLPLDVTGSDIAAFYVRKKQMLYVYIK